MLTIIQVGHVEASDRYIRNKVRAIEKAGLEVEVVNLPQDYTTADVVDAVESAAAQENVRAVMVQLPLPDHIDKSKVMESIPVWADIDGLNPRSDYQPLTPCAIMRWLSEQNIALSGKNVAILGRSELVGKPLANMMIDAGATVTVMNSLTQDWVRREKCRSADIVVSAVGKAGVITNAHVHTIPPKVVIDVGINRDVDGNLCGDVAAMTRRIVEQCGGICTPVPGGVGKWTVRELVLRLAEMEGQH